MPDDVRPCTEQPCPWMGYTDTKKCWFHSRGVPPMSRVNGEPYTEMGPMTFEEAKMGREESDD